VPAGPKTARQRAYDLLERGAHNDRAGDLVHGALVTLVLLSVIAVILESVPAYAGAFPAAFFAVELFTVVVFTAEYALRIWCAPEHVPWRARPPWQARLKLASQPLAIIDLLAILPFYLALLTPLDLRALLILRLLRFFKLARYSPGMASLFDAVYSERRGLVASLIILAGTTVVVASLMHVAEGEAQPERFGTIPGAMYWAVVTLTTVGYGDVVPVTGVGRVLAGLTAVTGILMLALPVGLLASAFAREIQRRDFVVTWGMVARVPLFAELDAAEISEVMSYLKAKYCEADDVIVRRGEPADSMYFIASGRVEVELSPEPAVLEAGEFFGEMAVLVRSERTANVRALTHTKLLVLDAGDLHYLVEHMPGLAEHIGQVAEERSRPHQQERLRQVKRTLDRDAR
jgi:voltage-gated potassium channel